MRANAGLYRARMSLDGVERLDCVECDDVEGWADVLAKNKQGEAYMVGDKVAIERVTGVVKIWFVPAAGSIE